MRRVVPLSALTVCFVLNACGVDDPEVRLPNSVKRAIAAESVPPKRNAVLELGLSAVGEQNQDRIVVRANVKNISARPVAWDRDFAAHVGWSVVDDKRVLLVREHVLFRNTPAPAESRDRFVILKPGESISKDIELTDRVQMSNVASVRMTMLLPNGPLGCLTNDTYSEEVSKFTVSERCKQVTVSWGYSVGATAMRASQDWFGEGLRGLPFCYDSLQSKPLTVSLKKLP
jgi:hypothetical protein